jgi:DHA1 family inner membrane transport protein
VAVTIAAVLWVGRVKAAADKAATPVAAELGPEPLGEV